MKVLIELIFLITACLRASGKKCFAPVLCMEEDASYPEWMQVFPTLRSASETTCPKISPTAKQQKQKISKKTETYCKNQTNSLRADTDAKLRKMNVSYSKLEQKLDATLNYTKTAEKKFDSLENKLSRLEKILNLTKKKSEIVSNCELKYEGKCFRAILITDGSYYVNYAAAAAMCTSIGWGLANIYSRNHYDEVVKYLRTTIYSFAWIEVWLGMTYDANTNTVYLSDGTQFTEKVPWYPSLPLLVASYNKIVVHINKDSNSTYQGLTNYPAGGGKTNGPLCQK